MNQWKKLFEQNTKRGEVSLKINDDIEHQEVEIFKSEAISIFKGISDEEGQLLNLNEEELLDDYNEEERTWIFKKLNRSFELLTTDCQQVLQWFYVED